MPQRPILKDPRIDLLLHGSTLQGHSSESLGWNGIAVERRTAPPLTRDDVLFDSHYLLLWKGQPMVTEKEFRKGQFRRVVKPTGTLSLGGCGLLPSVRAQSSYDVVACVLDPEALNQVATESDWGGLPEMYDQLGAEDPPLASLVELAAREVDEKGLHGRLYGDALGLAIMSRFLHCSSVDTRTTIAATALPRSRLRRVLDKIETEFGEDLSLSELANESGYSRSHFSRMFSAATGKAPHQYLLDVRLQRAREILLSGSDPITDVALSTGFSSHSHLTNQFRKRYGLTPSTLRRNK